MWSACSGSTDVQGPRAACFWPRFLSCSPGRDSLRRHDPHRILPLHGTRRPGDDASICSGHWGGFLPPLHHFFQTRILTILLALGSGHQLVSLNKPMAWRSDVSLLNNLLIDYRLVYCWVNKNILEPFCQYLTSLPWTEMKRLNINRELLMNI